MKLKVILITPVPPTVATSIIPIIISVPWVITVKVPISVVIIRIITAPPGRMVTEVGAVRPRSVRLIVVLSLVAGIVSSRVAPGLVLGLPLTSVGLESGVSV